jgi:hypothetical protein
MAYPSRGYLIGLILPHLRHHPVTLFCHPTRGFALALNDFEKRAF